MIASRLVHVVADISSMGALEDFLRDRGASLESALYREGAILFRDAPCDSATAFRRLVEHFAPHLMQENGEHTPLHVGARVYNPVRYAPEAKLIWHNENSFNAQWPDVIAFRCVSPADRGGETLLVDSREMLLELDPDLVEEFRAKGVCYVRTMGLGVGRDWRDVLRVESRDQAEQACHRQGCDFRWLGIDVLQTRSVRPAIVRHRRTGVESWFNQAQHWHQSCLDADVRAGLLEAFGAEQMPRDCLFGDGSRIDDAQMQCIMDAYARLERKVALHSNDVLVVDNVALAHGRAPYTGQRELQVVMGSCAAASGETQ